MAKQVEKLPEGKQKELFTMQGVKFLIVENSEFDGVGIYSIDPINDVVVEHTTLWATPFESVSFE